MVDISSQNNKINVTVSSSGNTANTNVTPDYAQYYSEKSKEWAISNRIVDNTDYSSKYYANESKKQADISTAKATEVVESGNTAVSNIENARDIAVFDVNTAGATQVALATEQATIATNKTSEVVENGNTALSNIDTAKDNAITSITNQETTSKTVLIDEGATQVGLIQNEGATQIANVQSTGFYMRDDKLYYINSQGEETEFKSDSGLEVCDIGMALYVDETKGLRRYLNGQIVEINSNTQAFLNRLLQIQTTNPEYFTTEDNWQAEALLNIDGCVYKFVLNYASDGETVVSVRLPKYPDYVEINAGGTLPVVGNGITLGLTDGTANFGFSTGTAYVTAPRVGNFGQPVGSPYAGATISHDVTLGVTTDPTKSGIEATLNQTKLKLRYYIQIATGQETEVNITNEIELNNPFSLFDSKYSDHELNNLSWLKSEGQWNAKAVYPTAYDKLLKVYNGTETVEGLSVKLSTEDYTDYDFVLNTADETFRLPLLDGSESLIGGRYNDLGVDTSKATWDFVAPANGFVSASVQFTNQATYFQIRNITKKYHYQTLLLTASGYQGNLLPVEKGDSYQILWRDGITPTQVYWARFYYAKGNGSLYYYVGETVQNANLINAGRIGEQLANKQDKCIHIIDTYVNGTSGYNVYSNGYCEQWGVLDRGEVTAPGSWSVALLKPYKDTNYNAIAINGGNTLGNGYGWHVAVANIAKTTTSFGGYGWKHETSNRYINWETKGYIT